MTGLAVIGLIIAACGACSWLAACVSIPDDDSDSDAGAYGDRWNDAA